MDGLRALLLSEDPPLGNSSSRLKLLEQSLSSALEEQPHLLHMLEKALARSDGKVPPGSNSARREANDDRFVLSLVAIDIGNEWLQRDDLPAAISSYRKSLVWFPRSIEGNLQLARTLKAQADAGAVVVIERCLRRAVSVGVDLPHHASGSAILQREKNCLTMAQEELALLLCQEGRGAEAIDLLRRMGYRWRLSDEVLNYPWPSPVVETAVKHSAEGIAGAVDNALPPEMVEHLRQVFRDSSPFWREHDYDVFNNASRSVGYFSYLYPFRRRSAQCSVESVMDKLFHIVSNMLPEVATDCQLSKIQLFDFALL